MVRTYYEEWTSIAHHVWNMQPCSPRAGERWLWQDVKLDLKQKPYSELGQHLMRNHIWKFCMTGMDRMDGKCGNEAVLLWWQIMTKLIRQLQIDASELSWIGVKGLTSRNEKWPIRRQLPTDQFRTIQLFTPSCAAYI